MGFLTMSNSKEIYSFKSKSDRVIVDYLAFTFSLKNLSHCCDALPRTLPSSKISRSSGFKNKKSLLQRCARAPIFPTPPEFNDSSAKTFEEIENYNEAYKTVFTDFLEDCLTIFTTQVLGLSMSPLRGVGFQFYTDSMKLSSPDGEDFCGFVGIGGNNDTVHFQINGTGCKHVFSKLATWGLHDWLHNVLGVTTLARVDLAFDDFDGNFDCEYARKAWLDNAFRTAPQGRGPKMAIGHEIQSIEDGSPIYSREQISIGSRTSRVYWRIYNKALEQKVSENGVVWYRSEVELKKWNIDVLLNPAGSFAAICDFSSSISECEAFNTKLEPKKRVALDVVSSAYWMRRQYGKILNSLIEFYDGDLETVVGSLIRDGSKFSFPDTHGKLINQILET